MSTQASGERVPPLRGYRRRKAMLDLNVPPSEVRDQEGTSTQNGSRGLQPSQQGQPVPPATIDVEALDDDVIESSPRAFAEAKSNALRNNAQRNHVPRARTSAVVVDVDSGRTTSLAYNNQNKRRRVSSNPTVINCDQYINLESSGSSKKNTVEPSPPPPPPPPRADLQLSNLLGPF